MRQALWIVVLSLSLVCAVNGGVVTHGNVNGLATFEDTNTGLVWVGLGNFFDMSYLGLEAAVTDAGFTVADATQVHTLLDSLPLDGGQWSGYRAIMGGAPNRELIWGAYLPEGSDQSWAWAYQVDTGWSFAADSGLPLDGIPNGGTSDADMNIWAFREESSVPEPSYTLLLGAAGTAMWFRRRRS